MNGEEKDSRAWGRAPAFTGMVAALCLGSAGCAAADRWGGSLGLTSDYLVRGISRSDDQVAAQADLHYLNASGFAMGLFASSARLNADESSNAEVSGFLGWTWTADNDWHGKVLATHYAYPWSRQAARYRYDELGIDVGYQEWLDLGLVYSPNARRFEPYLGIVDGTSLSGEVNVQWPVYRRLYATGGAGYSRQGGPDSGSYVYWSAGAAYDLAPVLLSLGFADTSAAARALFYDSAARGRWLATVIWRF